MQIEAGVSIHSMNVRHYTRSQKLK